MKREFDWNKGIEEVFRDVIDYCTGAINPDCNCSNCRYKTSV